MLAMGKCQFPNGKPFIENLTWGNITSE